MDFKIKIEAFFRSSPIKFVMHVLDVIDMMPFPIVLSPNLIGGQAGIGGDPTNASVLCHT